MTTNKNPSFVLSAIKTVSFEERPIPTLKNPTDVLVRVNVTGICGSDVHYWEHGRIASFILTTPMILGHESSGTIIRTGPSVHTLHTGDRVALEPGIPCRLCDPCKHGTYNLCPSMAFAATPPYDGTLSKYYVLPEDLCVKLPAHVSLDEGALVEPLAVGVHVVRQADVRPGESVVVFGAGPVGLLCAAVARAHGAGTVVVVDIVDSRLEFAAGYAKAGTFNAGFSRDAKVNAAEIVKRFELGAGTDVVIDASGAEPSIQTAVHLVRPGGRYVQAGMGKDEVTFPIMAMCCKEITVKGSFRYGPGDYRLAVELLASGKVSVKELISKRFKFEEAEEAFLEFKRGGGIKILIDGPLD